MIQRPKIEMLNKNDIVNDLNELDTKIKSFCSDLLTTKIFCDISNMKLQKK